VFEPLSINPLTANPIKPIHFPYWSNPPFLIFDIRALWHSVLSTRAPKCQKIKNGGLDQCGAELFEQQQLGTAGIEGVKLYQSLYHIDLEFHYDNINNTVVVEIAAQLFVCSIQFLHKLLDGICGRVPPSYTDYSKTWSLEEWWKVMDSCRAVITLFYRCDWSSQQV